MENITLDGATSGGGRFVYKPLLDIVLQGQGRGTAGSLFIDEGNTSGPARACIGDFHGKTGDGKTVIG